MVGQVRSRFVGLETKPLIQYGFLAAITLLAAALRLYKLGEWSFWIDEIATLNRAQIIYGNFESLIKNIPPAFNWIPLSVIFTAGVVHVLGVSEWSARMAPAIIGILTVPALYFPIKRAFNPGVALVSILLLAVSPWHLFWSQNARFFTSLMLFYSLALFALYFSLERDHFKYILIFIVLFYFALSERLFAFFIIPVIAGYLISLKVLPFDTPPGYRWRNILILILPVLVFLTYEIYRNFTSGLSITTSLVSTFWGKPIDSPARLLLLIVLEIGVPLVIIACFGAFYLLFQKDRAGLFFFLGAIIPVAILLALNPFMFTVNRYVFVTLPCWIILGAVAVSELVHHAQNNGRVLAVGVLFLLITDAAGENLMYYQLNNGNRLDWRGAMRFVSDNKMDGDLVVATRKQLGEYYLGDEVIDWKDFDPSLSESLDRRIWFIVDSEGVWHGSRASIKQEWLGQNAQLLQFWYLRVREQINLRIFMFDPLQKAANR